jgi:hypothetical protein
LMSLRPRGLRIMVAGDGGSHPLKTQTPALSPEGVRVWGSRRNHPRCRGHTPGEKPSSGGRGWAGRPVTSMMPTRPAHGEAPGGWRVCRVPPLVPLACAALGRPMPQCYSVALTALRTPIRPIRRRWLMVLRARSS